MIRQEITPQNPRMRAQRPMIRTRQIIILTTPITVID